jgi:16S rRNA (cytidine1402-2'-O)-methyltransferase
VARLRSRYGDTLAIETIPGPSAVAAALAVSGLSGDQYLFLGFPPHKKGRKTFFDMVAASTYTTVFYESPHRAMKALAALNERLDDARTVVVCRELTKLHEEVVSGSAGYVERYFAEHPDHVRGEFVLLVAAER